MLGFSIILGFNITGLLLQIVLHVPLPGNVIGMLLFTIALFCKWVRLEWVEETAAWLTKHMLLFFTPYVVGTLAFFPLIGSQWISIAGGLIGSTLLVLIVTGWVTSKLQKQGEANE